MDGKELVAEILSEQSEKISALSRGRQLPNTSVMLDDGSESSVVDGVSQSKDATAAVATLDSQVADVSDITVAQVDESTAQPDRVAAGDTSSDFAIVAMGKLGLRVGTALAAADEAATEAAFAKETSLGNARYSQVDGGPIVPPLPEDGPRVGAELVFIDSNNHPYQVNVWSGTAWVKSQYLLDQALFLSPDGTIQIGNGVLVSPVIIGGDFLGNTFVGGLFTLPSVASETIVASDTFETDITMWVNADAGYTNPVRSTAQAQSGSASLLLGRNGKQFGAYRIMPFTSFPGGGYISVWVRRSSDGRVALGSDDSGVQTPKLIMGNVWTEVRRELAPNATINGMWVLGELPDTGGTVYVDSVRVVKYNSSAGLAAIDRDDSGRARVYSTDAAGNLSGLRDGRAYSEFRTSSSVTYSSETRPISGGGLGTQGVEHVLKQAYSGFTGELKMQMSSTGTGYLVSTGTDRAQSLIEMTEDILLRGSRIHIDGPVVFQGDTNWIPFTLGAGWAAVAGVTPGYRVRLGKFYTRGRVERTSGADIGVSFTGAVLTANGAVPNLPGLRDTSGSPRSSPGLGVNSESLTQITDAGAIRIAAPVGVKQAYLTAEWLLG